MRASHHPESYRVPPKGALLSLPTSPGRPRRYWVTQGSLRRSRGPRPGVFSVYAPDFFLDDSVPWYLPDDTDAQACAFELPDSDLRRHVSPLVGTDAPPETLAWTPPSLPLFNECFEDLQTQFQSCRLAKAVPVFFEHAASHPSDARLASWVAALLDAPESLMPYGFWSEQQGFLGASPELLFEIRDGVLRTMALAGTLSGPETTDARATSAAEAAFLADPKERREHCLVIDGIIDSLSPFGPVKIGETRVLKLPTLWHLQTPIEVVLQEPPDFEFLVRRLHPTPALGGAPRDASFQWLRQQDARQSRAHRRGGFGAPFGAQCPDGSAFCLVAVRSLMWDADSLRIGAGCGIIRESRREREWEELRQKRNSVKRLFGL